MLVANIKIWKSHLNIREGSDYLSSRTLNIGNVEVKIVRITEMLQMGLDPRKSVLEVFRPDQAAKLQRLCRILKAPYIKSEVNILSKK